MVRTMAALRNGWENAGWTRHSHRSKQGYRGLGRGTREVSRFTGPTGLRTYWRRGCGGGHPQALGSSMARDRVGKWSWRVGMPAAWTGPFTGGEEEQGLAAGGRLLRVLGLTTPSRLLREGTPRKDWVLSLREQGSEEAPGVRRGLRSLREPL